MSIVLQLQLGKLASHLVNYIEVKKSQVKSTFLIFSPGTTTERMNIAFELSVEQVDQLRTQPRHKCCSNSSLNTQYWPFDDFQCHFCRN
jgi:hypothetical protein